MGHTLYDTIQLGRSPLHLARRVQLALALGLAAGLGWLALRALR